MQGLKSSTSAIRLMNGRIVFIQIISFSVLTIVCNVFINISSKCGKKFQANALMCVDFLPDIRKFTPFWDKTFELC